MKITGWSVDETGDGYSITVKALVNKREELEPNDIVGIIDALREMGEGSRDTVTDESWAKLQAEASQPRRRRRGVDPVGDRFADALDTPTAQAEIKAANEALKAIEAEAAALAAEQPTRRRRRSEPTDNQLRAEEAAYEEAAAEQPPRRRRGAVPTTDASTAAPDANSSKPTPTDASPVSRRRRGAGYEITGQTGVEAVETTLTPEPRRRRRAEDPTPAPAAETTTGTRRRRGASSADTSKPQSPSDDEITDADLSRACSAAARVILPKGVMEILGEFGVENSQSIAQKDRREFLDALKEASEA